jgi:hypothetical protein
MNFVYDVDFETAFAGGEVDFVAQVADVVYAGVGGGVYFDQVEEAALTDCLAGVALVARPFSQFIVQAVGRFRQQSGGGGFAGSTRAGEEIGVADAAGGDSVLQGVGDVFLADYLVKARRPPFAIEGL